MQLKSQFWYFEHWAPFLVCLGWNRMVDTEILTIGPGSFQITPACFRMAWKGMNKPVLKTTLNVQRCATHWVVSGVCWCSKSSIVAKYGTKYGTKCGTKYHKYSYIYIYRNQWYLQSVINAIKQDRNCISLQELIWNINEHH